MDDVVLEDLPREEMSHEELLEELYRRLIMKYRLPIWVVLGLSQEEWLLRRLFMSDNELITESLADGWAAHYGAGL